MLRIAILLVAFAATGASAHDWYSLACCDDRDCEPVAAGVIQQTAEGYLVTVNSETHSLGSTRGYTEIVPYGDRRIKPSQDENMHLCLGLGFVRCIYVPMMF